MNNRFKIAQLLKDPGGHSIERVDQYIYKVKEMEKNSHEG
jgi:hypothetical protein